MGIYLFVNLGTRGTPWVGKFFHPPHSLQIFKEDKRDFQDFVLDMLKCLEKRGETVFYGPPRNSVRWIHAALWNLNGEDQKVKCRMRSHESLDSISITKATST